MSTVDAAFAENLKQHAGYYNGNDDNSMGDNPRVVEITEYDNAYGGVAYGLTFAGKRNVYTASDFVRNPRQFWKYEG